MDSTIKCWNHSLNVLFPKDIPNKNIVYFINIIHIIGVLFIQYGAFLPTKYLKYHLIYIIAIFTTYIIFKNKCFMTILSNYYSKRIYKFLCFKMNDAKILLILSLFANVIFTIEPSISPYNFINKIL